MVQVTCVADIHAVLGEGPVWVERERALYWVDIKGLKIFRLGEDGAVEEWATPLRVGSIAPRAGGGFIAGTEDGIAEIDLSQGRFSISFNPFSFMAAVTRLSVAAKANRSIIMSANLRIANCFPTMFFPYLRKSLSTMAERSFVRSSKI